MQVIKKLSFTAKIKLFCRKPSQQNSTLLAGDNHCSNIFQASKDEDTSVKLLSYAKKKKKIQLLDPNYFTGHPPNQILCEARLFMVIHDSDLLFPNFLSLSPSVAHASYALHIVFLLPLPTQIFFYLGCCLR